MRKMKKVFAGLLACALAVSLLPGQALALGMRGGPAGLSIALQVGSNSYKVAFAGYEWLVIGYSGIGVYSTVEDNAATLLAANYDFGDSSFNNSTADGNAYAKSELQQKMESIAKEFPDQEQALINPRDFSSDDGIAGDEISGQLLWALSTEEADNEQLTDTLRSYQEHWWLRSPVGSSSAARVLSSGPVSSEGMGVNYENGVRPAFNLNLSAYLFVSDASEATGKAAAAVGKGLVSTGRTSNTVKFTMKSDSQKLNVDDVDSSYEVVTGNSLSFTYQNATTGSNQYVSCVLTDTYGDVKYYGKLADSSSAAGGSISVPFSGVAPGTYTLQIFSEEANGPLYTDFCSEPVTMTVEVQHTPAQHKWSTAWYSDDTHHWHECTAAYCPVTDNSQKDGYAEHTYNQKVISDTYLASAATCTDPAEYYYSCVCGAKGTSTFTSGTATGHSWGTPVWEWSDDGKTAAVIFTCENDSSHTEKPAVSITSEVKTPATCTSAGTTTYTAKATFRGVEYSDKKDVEDIAATGHRWSDWQSNGDGTHTRTCQNQNCNATETENCTGGTATCTSKATCSICSAPYGEADPDNHTGTAVWVQTATTHKKIYNCCQAEEVAEADHTWENGTCTVCQYPCLHEGGTATCTAKAVCDICGGEYGEVNPDNHSPADEWTQENDKHYHACLNGCGTHLDEAACSGGTATCTERAVCTTCGKEYGELAPHELMHYDEEPATCTEPGNMVYWRCETCGRNFADEAGRQELASVESPALGHDVVKSEAKAPTATEPGNIEYWQCKRCGKYFKDEALTEEITQEQTVLAATGETEPSTPEDNPSNLPEDNPGTKETDAPRTGDDSNIALWMAVMLAAGAALTGTAVYDRKRKYSR